MIATSRPPASARYTFASFPVEIAPSDGREALLVDELVQGEQGHLVEDVVADLELVGVLDPDAERLELLIEPILVPASHHRHPR